MKDITTLVDDIEQVLDSKYQGEINPKALQDFYDSSGMALIRAVESPERGPRHPNTLYASEIKEVLNCPRKFWYKVHHSELGEELRPQTRLKFMYGDLTESLMLFLADQAGHTVEDIQKRYELELNGVKISGRIDARIDGLIVDVKSASPYAYKKMTDPSYDPSDDPFSYNWQMTFYSLADHIDNGQVDLLDMDHSPYNLVPSPLLLMDKQNGNFDLGVLPIVKISDVSAGLMQAVANAKSIYHYGPSALPSLSLSDERLIADKETTNGNRKLGVYCSYCPFKMDCWAQEGKPLRGFAYSTGPVWMTEVNKVPKNVPEFTE